VSTNAYEATAKTAEEVLSVSTTANEASAKNVEEVLSVSTNADEADAKNAEELQFWAVSVQRCAVYESIRSSLNFYKNLG
jgi:hypothetical protein